MAGTMQNPVLRIAYTNLLPPPTILPSSANLLRGAVDALQKFILAPSTKGLPQSTVVLTGAGLSVASGLADYRGVNGTYRVNKTYRPIYYGEFVNNHNARKRYWARSFLGLSNLERAAPNAGHYAVRDLANLGLVRDVITQNVDSFHSHAHPDLPTIELHGYLRSIICTSCRSEFSRQDFQQQLSKLNPKWDEILQLVLASGELGAGEDPNKRRKLGIKTNPDGDVDLPDAPYTTFRYPPCPKCLTNPIKTADGSRQIVQTDAEGAWAAPSNGGILKPSVVMFGENIVDSVKHAAEEAIDRAGKLLVLGTSLATYSAWRLAKRAKDRGMPIAIINIGGVRGEDLLFKDLSPTQDGEQGVRTEISIDTTMPSLVKALSQHLTENDTISSIGRRHCNNTHFKDMLS